MLALKLLIVPAFLFAVSVAAGRWGARAGGILAGLPVVAGPILLVLALEQDAAFAAAAAAGSLAAVAAVIAFLVAYAHACTRVGWAASALAGVMAWSVVAGLITLLPAALSVSGLVSYASLLLAPRLFPRPAAGTVSYRPGAADLGVRMAAGALVCMVVAALSEHLGATWSGLLAVFPTMAVVLAVFSQRSAGAAYSAALLRGMATGLHGLSAFCLALALALEHGSLGAAFLVASAAALVVQWFVARRR